MLRGSPETGDGEGRRECLPDGQGGKLLSGKGKAVLFTALSTGNGDKVVSVAGCACVGAGGGRQVLPDGFFMPFLHGGGGFVRDAVCVVFRLCQAVRCAGMMAQTGRFFPDRGGGRKVGVILRPGSFRWCRCRFVWCRVGR